MDSQQKVLRFAFRREAPKKMSQSSIQPTLHGFFRIRGEYYSKRGLLALLGGLLLLISLSIDFSYGKWQISNVYIQIQIELNMNTFCSQLEHLRDILHETQGFWRHHLCRLDLLFNDQDNESWIPDACRRNHIKENRTSTLSYYRFCSLQAGTPPEFGMLECSLRL